MLYNARGDHAKAVQLQEQIAQILVCPRPPIQSGKAPSSITWPASTPSPGRKKKPSRKLKTSASLSIPSWKNGLSRTLIWIRSARILRIWRFTPKPKRTNKKRGRVCRPAPLLYLLAYPASLGLSCVPTRNVARKISPNGNPGARIEPNIA